MKKTILAASTALFALAAAPTFAQDRTEVGVLDCVMDGGFKLNIISSEELSCTYTPADDSRAPESYVGTVSKFGIEVGATSDKLLRWLVLAPTADPLPSGALEGSYVGASGEITAGIGAGANVLIGGSDDTIALQPVSVQAQTGVNIALGVSEFELQAVAD